MEKKNEMTEGGGDTEVDDEQLALLNPVQRQLLEYRLRQSERAKTTS